LSRYTASTDRPTLLPPWSFGLWLTTSLTADYGAKGHLERLKSHLKGVPPGVHLRGRKKSSLVFASTSNASFAVDAWPKAR
jgi:hypothetical protein